MKGIKQVSSLLLIATLGGIISIGADKLFFNSQGRQLIKEDTLSTSVHKTDFKIRPYANAAENTDFTQAASETVNAVVHVKNTATKSIPDPFSNFFFGGNAVPREFEQVGTGSGVIISSDGYIVTNNHVIDKANEIEITLNNKEKYIAELIGTDSNNDIALLKIDAKDLHFIPFGDSDLLKVGQWVLAVGNPYNLTSTVTAGIISATGRDLHSTNHTDSFIQTDAAVNPGNSGGALVNTRGELVGINTAISSQTGSFVGYSFAVPSNIANKIIQDIMEYGDVQQAYLGISIQELDAKKAKEYEAPSPEGIVVMGLSEDGAAIESGLKKGDVITQVDDRKIKKLADLKGYVSAKRPGDNVEVTIYRKGKKIKIPVKLKNQFGKDDLGSADYASYYLGTFTDIPKKEKNKLDIGFGLKIKSIANEDLTERFGIEKGDYLMGIDNYKVRTLEDVENLLRNAQGRDYVIIQFLTKEGNIEYVPLKVN